MAQDTATHRLSLCRPPPSYLYVLPPPYCYLFQQPCVSQCTSSLPYPLHSFHPHPMFQAGETPLHLAALNGRTEKVNALLAAGAKKDIATKVRLLVSGGPM